MCVRACVCMYVHVWVGVCVLTCIYILLLFNDAKNECALSIVEICKKSIGIVKVLEKRKLVRGGGRHLI